MKQTHKLLLSVACIAGALALTTATTQAASNLLIDPGFESGVAGQPNPIPIPGGAGGGWAGFNGATYSTTHPEACQWGMQDGQNAAQAWNFAAPYQVVGGVVPGMKYTLTADYSTTT